MIFFMKNTLLLFFLFASLQIMAQAPNEKSTIMYHQFDFWLGHWDVYKYDTDTLVGESFIESIIDSFGILENYSVVNGKYQGKSLNKYNPGKERWEQYWIDNSGLTLFLSGCIVDKKMVLDDLENGDPNTGFNRIVWENINDFRVRQSWYISKDNGVSWNLIFDGEYKRKANQN